MHKISFVLFASAAVLICAPPDAVLAAQRSNIKAAEAEKIVLDSHKAVYRMTLTRAAQQEGVRSAAGRLTYTFVDRCDAYTIESELSGQFSFSNGLTSTLKQRYAAWESKDGRRATFRLQAEEGGKSTDNFRGTVALNRDGTGEARYMGAQPVVYDLPKGTMLSSMQTKALLASAYDGDVQLVHVVMDGSFADGPQRVSAILAPSRAMPPVEGTVSGRSGKKSEETPAEVWPITMAYFPLNAADETPSYEMAVLIDGNGIIHHMSQDFGSYTLQFEPESIVKIDAEPCERTQ